MIHFLSTVSAWKVKWTAGKKTSFVPRYDKEDLVVNGFIPNQRHLGFIIFLSRKLDFSIFLLYAPSLIFIWCVD